MTEVLKQELQGREGLFARLRKACMPSGITIAEEARTHLGHHDVLPKEEVRRCFNALLDQALQEEYAVFRRYEQQVYRREVANVIFGSEGAYLENYPCVQALREVGLDIVASEELSDYEKLAQIYEKLFDLTFVVAQSMTQSRSARAGGSMQYQLEHLFERCGFLFEKQTRLNGPVDFLFPSERYFNRYKHDAIVLSVKRTLRERWQQSVAELQAAGVGRIFLATADREEASEATLKRMDDLNVTLVVFDELKRDFYADRRNVIGYSEFIEVNMVYAERLWCQRLERLE